MCGLRPISGGKPNQATLPLHPGRGILVLPGRVPKWLKGTDCKSVIRGFESRRGLLRPCASHRGGFHFDSSWSRTLCDVLFLTALLQFAPPQSGVPERPVRFNEGARVLSLNIRLEQHTDGTRLVPASPSPTLPKWFQSAPCSALERLEDANQKRPDQEWNIAAEVLLDQGRPVLLLTRDALRSAPEEVELPTDNEINPAIPADDENQADEIAARLRAAAGPLLRAGTIPTEALPDDVSRTARVIDRRGRLVLSKEGLPRFVPEGAGQAGVVHPILPCRMRAALTRTVIGQGEGVSVRITGRIHRYRGTDWLRPERFRVMPTRR